MLGALAVVARCARDHEVLGAVAAVKRERDDVVGVVGPPSLFVAPVAATVLTLTLRSDVSGCVVAVGGMRTRSASMSRGTPLIKDKLGMLFAPTLDLRFYLVLVLLSVLASPLGVSFARSSVVVSRAFADGLTMRLSVASKVGVDLCRACIVASTPIVGLCPPTKRAPASVVLVPIASAVSVQKINAEDVRLVLHREASLPVATPPVVRATRGHSRTELSIALPSDGAAAPEGRQWPRQPCLACQPSRGCSGRG